MITEVSPTNLKMAAVEDKAISSSSIAIKQHMHQE